MRDDVNDDLNTLEQVRGELAHMHRALTNVADQRDAALAKVDILRAQTGRLELERAHLQQELFESNENLAEVANAYVDECRRNGSTVPRAELLGRLGMEDEEP